MSMTYGDDTHPSYVRQRIIWRATGSLRGSWNSGTRWHMYQMLYNLNVRTESHFGLTMTCGDTKRANTGLADGLLPDGTKLLPPQPLLTVGSCSSNLEPIPRGMRKITTRYVSFKWLIQGYSRMYRWFHYISVNFRPFVVLGHVE